MEEELGVSDESVVKYEVVTFSGGRRLREVLEYCHKEVVPLIGDYQWHREAFNLNFFILQEIACLYGITDIGSCLEDEWVIVFLLRKLSEKFSDIWVQVTDTDGEFLLIEAANVLPKWLVPEISDNRIWINNGEVCIIPDHEFAEIAPTFREAVEYLRLGGDMYRDERVTKEAFNRMKDYPEQAKANSTHRIKVIVPRKVAALLKQYPVYMSLALELFNSRSPEDEKIVRRRAVFPQNDTVECTVRFTRLQYAHMLGQPFDEDIEDDRESMGNKVSAAMELLYAHSLSYNYLTDENVYDEPAFKDFLQNLAQDGYFMGEVPGTEKYNDMRDLAVQPYLESTRMQNEKGLFVKRTGEIELPTDEEIARWDQTTDSDKWLDLYLNDPEGKPDANNEEEMSTRVQEMLSKVQHFMNDGSAGLDGVNYYEEDDSSSSSSSDEDDDTGEPLFGPDDPKIDEDDFLEFFLKEALKLSPEEIESYRADHNSKPKPQMNTVPEEKEEEVNNEEEDDGFDEMEAELKKAGILSDDAPPDQQVLQNLLESIKSGGGVTGPAATLLGQLGIPIPRPDDFKNTRHNDNESSSDEEDIYASYN
ncbi:hypothetical protein TRICI_005209 [Trichomonascus ciferrii]|uniref:SGT1 protein n=1 Tax=Trichomonascus ciferrii TaxID=44093 RepID=A0A642UZQ7_9ASCO|nr:hypothetical protein TRICI_005209 [Trichomonascus ciferrii]